MANRRGGPEFLEWDMQTEILAAIHDSLSFNTEATGNWKKKPPPLPRIPRPSPPKQKPKNTVNSLFATLSGAAGTL